MLDIKMDEKNGTLKEKKVVFVTVGTTCFDALVRAVDTPEVKNELFKKGYTNILIQMGRGSCIPTKLLQNLKSYARLERKIKDRFFASMMRYCILLLVVLEYFTFSSSIADYLKEASLVISHAGSGSIFETLRLGKPLIVVVNEDLMDNHQSELAEELAERKHLLCARPQTSYETIADMDTGSLITYQPGDAEPVAKLISRYLEFPDDKLTYVK